MDTLPLRGHLRIVGSTALQPLATEAARLFEKHYPSTHIDVQGGGGFAGLDAVTTQAADIGTSDVYADPVSYPDPTLTDHIICITPFVVIVNPDVPVLSLSRQQLVEIFVTRSIKNWQVLNVFLNFILSPQVQQMAEQKGYIPLAQISLPQEKVQQ
ncbi:MAG: hypothetical protein NVSMB44_44950 [Ktedonobacteraceae bacterium]